MEQIEYILHPDGRIEERVTGIAGSRCSELTRSIEAALGHTANRELTTEYYQQAPQTQALHNSFDGF